MSTHRRVKKLAATGGTVATKEEAERGLDSREPLHRRTRRAYLPQFDRLDPRFARGWGERTRAYESLSLPSTRRLVFPLPTTPAGGRRPTAQCFKGGAACIQAVFFSVLLKCPLMSATPRPGTISWQDLTVDDAEQVRD